ncbi:hypothetical protein [Saccharopolyspora hattusasensis]|uniref:hypothetical protein n=1 Tax=Saccharopolyspora hattusasensis TaxID=1128679 RepID=UPI003D95A0E7
MTKISATPFDPAGAQDPQLPKSSQKSPKFETAHFGTITQDPHQNTKSPLTCTNVPVSGLPPTSG